MRHRLLLWLICALFCLSLTGCGAAQESSHQPQTQQEAQDGEELPGILSTFHAQNLEGEAVDQSILSDYPLTMVNVWATYCGPCLEEMPDLGQLSQEYEGEGLQIIGLLSDALDSDGSVNQDQVDTARQIVEATGASYPHLVPREDLFGLLGQITAVPTTFFVDSQGNQVGSAYLGAMEKEDWAQIIDQMLEEVEG